MSNISFLLFPFNLQHGRDPAADSKKRIKADSTAEHHHREDMSPAKYGPVQGDKAALRGAHRTRKRHRRHCQAQDSLHGKEPARYRLYAKGPARKVGNQEQGRQLDQRAKEHSGHHHRVLSQICPSPAVFINQSFHFAPCLFMVPYYLYPGQYADGAQDDPLRQKTV